MNFPNRGFYRGDLNSARKDYEVLLVPSNEKIPPGVITAGPPPVVTSESIEQTLLHNPTTEARLQGFTGSQCHKCNSMRVVMTGHCETCQDCGETTACA